MSEDKTPTLIPPGEKPNTLDTTLSELLSAIAEKRNIIEYYEGQILRLEHAFETLVEMRRSRSPFDEPLPKEKSEVAIMLAELLDKKINPKSPPKYE